MDDLIASLNVGVHVSQESYDLESFKATLARTLVVPSSPATPSLSSSFSSSFSSSALGRTRPSSIALPSTLSFSSLDSLGGAQPFPSPTVSLKYDPFFMDEMRGETPAPPYEQHAYHAAFDEDMDLEAAFAGDAFAPLHEEQKDDPWARFRDGKQAAFGAAVQQQPSLPAFQVQQVQPAFLQQQAPQYDTTDEDQAEAMITDE